MVDVVMSCLYLQIRTRESWQNIKITEEKNSKRTKCTSSKIANTIFRSFLSVHNSHTILCMQNRIGYVRVMLCVV